MSESGTETDFGPDKAYQTADVAAFIAQIASELAELAANSSLPMLAYFLRLSHPEAETEAQKVRVELYSANEST